MIIGSTAIKAWYPDFPREPKDLDIIVYDKKDIVDIITNDSKKIELLVNPVLIDYCKNTNWSNMCCGGDVSYTLKVSHIFWDLENGSWYKHMSDIQFLKSKKCKLIKPLFNDLYKYWNTVHGVNKRSDLNMSANEFFDNVVNFPVEHDTIHEKLIKHGFFNKQEPTYKSILKENCQVDVSEEKFKNLSELNKLHLVLEEVMVMAYERYKNVEKRSTRLHSIYIFNRMLKKFIISHAPMWEALWIVDNYSKINKYHFNFIKHLNNEFGQKYN